MNILVIGSGGREHALCWAIARSPRCDQLYCAPGNAGIAQCAQIVALDPADHDAVISFCRHSRIALVVIGPEAPLVAGLADDLKDAGIAAFGPSARAAQLEGSKGFTKDLCARHNIPTAAYGRFDNETDAVAYLADHSAPIVIKADGLAAGKGVIIAQDDEEARQAVSEIFGGAFGAAGSSVVIEEFLQGEEASLFALVDGKTALPMAGAQDHKRVGDGDTGPNTGGMGAYSPAPILDAAMTDSVMREIVQPTVDAMAAESMAFTGVLYAGLMITDTGPKLIEYNVRFGDPECQVVMMRLASDVVDAMLATVEGRLDQISLAWKDDAALTVVMAALGYPGPYEKGSIITGLDRAGAPPDVEIFHAGTKRANDSIIATGGRVLNVTATGATVAEAQAKAYAAIDEIDWPEGFCRRDIGWRAIVREKGA